MKRALILKHVPFEGPARIAERLARRGYEPELRELHRGDPLPRRLADGELLVVMGGPMGVGDADDPRWPFLRAELELLERCIAADAPVLGVCLGAQLLAAAAGASVQPMKNAAGHRVYEIGWANLSFVHDPGNAALLAGLPDQATMLHWHGDAAALPRGARLLASTGVCNNQAFALGSRQFGLQFHCEVDVGGVEGFLASDADFVRSALGDGAAAQI
ncbi:MAG: gamma-glutamyl-gamma-aminobutyrate hydrolase family protein, partial [Polyangiaceae bacterium]